MPAIRIIPVKAGIQLHIEADHYRSIQQRHASAAHIPCTNTRVEPASLLKRNGWCTAQEYNYNVVLGKSLDFFEAQRSGVLPANNSIPWRGDSALSDVSPGGGSLVGGYYNDGGMDVVLAQDMSITMVHLCLLVDSLAARARAAGFKYGML